METLSNKILRDPSTAVQLILGNNPEAVDLNLVDMGLPAGTDQARAESLRSLLNDDPDKFLEALSVPLIPERMTTETQGQVFQAVEYFGGSPVIQARGAGQAKAGEGWGLNYDPPAPLSLDNPGNVSTGGGASWNWNNFAELLVGAGMDVYLNETGGKDGGAGAVPPATPAQPSWMPWAIAGAVLLAGVIIYLFARKR